MDKPVVKKKSDDPFAEVSFSQQPDPLDSAESDSDSEPASKPDSKPEPKSESEPPATITPASTPAVVNRPKAIPAAQPQLGEGEKVVGVNALTQKPIIKSIEKKPLIVKSTVVSRESEEDVIVQDLVPESASNELRKRSVRDITPVSNAPSSFRQRELSKDEAVALARKIYEEKESTKPWHRKVLKSLGFR